MSHNGTIGQKITHLQGLPTLTHPLSPPMQQLGTPMTPCLTMGPQMLSELTPFNIEKTLYLGLGCNKRVVFNHDSCLDDTNSSCSHLQTQNSGAKPKLILSQKGSPTYIFQNQKFTTPENNKKINPGIHPRRYRRPYWYNIDSQNEEARKIPG